ncbi:MAG: beta-L-arabinofuranosidase domain-containing protein [Asticcacaulis sp.]
MRNATRRGALTSVAALTATGMAAAGIATRSIAATGDTASVEPFPLSAVRLKPSPFLTAVEANQRYLLSLSADRFLHNFRLYAGLPPKGELYGGWEARGIAGHSLGHYQSALSLIYAQTGKPEFRERALYITRELALIQAKNGDGYAGGTNVDRDGKTVDGKVIFEEIRRGDIRTQGFDLNGGWVPLYTYHKVLAGTLDAHHYCNDPASLEVALGLAGYLGGILEGLSDAQIQEILRAEHGGLNECYAELYARTGNKRWLTLAERIRHRAVLDALAEGRDELAGKHANTQIPKVIGLSRIYEVAPTDQHRHDCAKAALFFWETVTKDHSYVIGGNSEYEHFGEPRKLSKRLGQQTCEHCNTYNMLKLTRHLYGWSGDARYFDFYERAHLNHTMSAQDPETGMFTYFTPLASGYGRVHSSPDNDFWCCVGSGMESHAKHGESIWWHRGSQVVVNLYYASTLDWAAKGVKLDMDTAFPADGEVRLKVTKAARPVELSLRVPYWCASPRLSVNGRARQTPVRGGYVTLSGLKAGDVVHLSLDMAVHTETMPDDDRLVAFLNGPLVLAADLGPSDKPWEGIDPVVVGDSNDRLVVRSGETFGFGDHGRPQNLVVRPFYTQHHNRTAVYFRRFTPSEWPQMEASLRADAARKADIERRTIDFIRLGEQQPETDHAFQGTPNTAAVTHIAERGRVMNKGYFQFEMAVKPGPLDLQVSYNGADRNKDFTILADGQVVAHETLPGESSAGHNVITYPLPDLSGKSKVTIRFEAAKDQWMTVFECRVVARAASASV